MAGEPDQISEPGQHPSGPHPTVASVAVPTEHGGWSLTLEPVLLGLLVRPSWPGVLLGLVALGGFLIRTPLKIALVDRRRRRRLPRTVLAERVARIELLVVGLLGVAAWVLGDRRFVWPLLAAAPLLAIGFSYDIRSRSRRLLPELTGTVGVASMAAAVALAGGEAAGVAGGLWLVAAARAVAAVVFVRVQLRRAKHRPHRIAASDSAQVAALGAVALGSWAGIVPWLAWGAVGVLAGAHAWLVRRPPPTAPVLGAQQVVLGLFLVLTVGLAVAAP